MVSVLCLFHSEGPGFNPARAGQFIARFLYFTGKGSSPQVVDYYRMAEEPEIICIIIINTECRTGLSDERDFLGRHTQLTLRAPGSSGSKDSSFKYILSGVHV